MHLNPAGAQKPPGPTTTSTNSYIRLSFRESGEKGVCTVECMVGDCDGTSVKLKRSFLRQAMMMIIIYYLWHPHKSPGCLQRHRDTLISSHTHTHTPRCMRTHSQAHVHTHTLSSRPPFLKLFRLYFWKHNVNMLDQFWWMFLKAEFHCSWNVISPFSGVCLQHFFHLP